MTTIAPCPFCGCELEKSETFSTRSTAHFVHPHANEDEECIATSIRVLISDREDDKRRLASWNRRTPPPQTREVGSEDLRKRVMRAIFDPSETVGAKGDRDLPTWQTDAVMNFLSKTEQAP